MKEEIFIPSPLAEQLEKAAEEQGMTADEIAENAIRNFINRSDSNGRGKERYHRQDRCRFTRRN